MKSDRQCNAKKCTNEYAICYSWGDSSYRFCNKHNDAFWEMPGNDLPANAKRMTQTIIYKMKAKPKPEPKPILMPPSPAKVVVLAKGQQKLGE